ncbi:hypothetical protein JAAARDRAFT_416418 [Jaapia argillacea MUCL 33604]|uniref:RING-type domain-containing protein n=1 Tax=Jaapia argillacea MUCL 33604 TaxID=933084 RepID=A0A067PUA3_9AGAM|nr:hypothetical protein JAAARDRAFT_416418 [Jaapia argillacea MUCL 33604]
MLVIHPLSRCDVCLDEYSFATPDQTPHAISCGHIFCNVCLQRCNPSQCPLCRKGFTRDRVKRLVVDRLPPNEAAEVPGTPGPPLPSQLEREEILLLQRLALVWRENAPQADVDSVITDVKRWLSENDGDRHRPLRNAVEAIRRYANLEEKLAIQISRYESKKSEYSHKSKNMEIIHKNFLEHVQNLESQHKTQVGYSTLTPFSPPLTPPYSWMTPRNRSPS